MSRMIQKVVFFSMTSRFWNCLWPGVAIYYSKLPARMRQHATSGVPQITSQQRCPEVLMSWRRDVTTRNACCKVQQRRNAGIIGRMGWRGCLMMFVGSLMDKVGNFLTWIEEFRIPDGYKGWFQDIPRLDLGWWFLHWWFCFSFGTSFNRGPGVRWSYGSLRSSSCG